MPEFDTATRVANACPICQSAIDNGDLFCPRCGNFLHGDNSSPDALNLPIVHLLTQVCTLQKDLLHQYRTGQALQARQFQQALRLQAEQLNQTLAHAARQIESQERKLRLMVAWATGIAATAVALIIIITQITN